MNTMVRRFTKQGIAAGTLLETVGRLFYGMFVIGLVVLFIKLVVFTTLETGPLEISVVAHRIYNSPALMEQDAETGRVYPGIVDLEKYRTPETLDQDINYFNRYRVAAEVILFKQNTGPHLEVINDPYVPFDTALYLNENLWRILEPRHGLSGPEGGTKKAWLIPVMYRENGALHNAQLAITVLRQND